MKFLFFTDIHVRGTTPENRNGDFKSDLLTKFKESVQIGIDKSVDFFVSGGDFTDAFNTSEHVIDEFIDVIEASGKPFYEVIGNHSTVGHNPDIKTTILQHYFRRCSFFKHLTTLELDKVIIYGFDYYHTIESDMKSKGLFVPETNKYKIGIPHAFIHNKKLPEKANAILPEEIKTNLDLILITHDHSEWGIKKVGNTTYVSIGALARISAHELDWKRHPKVLIFDDNTLTWEIIELKSARPCEGLFKLEQIQQKKNTEAQITAFFEGIKNTKIDKTNVEDIINQIIIEKNVDESVSKAIFERWN